MKIQRIEIQNFRGLKSATIDDCNEVNVFVGPNGSGKSSVLEAIYLAATPCATHDPLEPKKTRMEILGARHNTSPWDPGLHFQHKDVSIMVRMLFPGYPWFEVTKASHDTAPAVAGPVSEKLVAFGRNIVLMDSCLLRNIIELPYWHKEVKRRGDKQIVSMLNKVYELNLESIGYLPGISTEAVHGELWCSFESYSLRMDDLGTGMRIAFRLLLVCRALTETAVLFEEIDAYQHPNSLSKLAAVILELSKSAGLQFFLTTHSLETCETLAKIAKARGDVTMSFYSLELNEEGILTARRSDLDAASRLIASGYDLRT